MKKVFIIANPVAGGSSRRKIEKALYILKGRGYIPQVLYTERQGDGVRLAKEILKDNNPDEIHAVIAAGGDGTFNEVANVLTGTSVPMAILPLGTTNVLAKELRIPENESALDLLEGKPLTVRPALITLKTPSMSLRRYFLLMAGIGFDGEAVYGVNKRLKRFSGKLAYILSGAKVFLRPEGSILNIKLEVPDGEVYPVEGFSAVICKGACYGGYFRMAPDASLREPDLYAVIFTGGDRSSILRYVLGVLTGRHVRFKDVIYRKVKGVIVETERHIQIDGDYLGKGPVEISSGTEGLRIFSSSS